MEHPFYGSWGYQITGYFAPTSRYGTPQDFMYLIDYLHQRGIGVILDWVPAHFPTDEHGLGLLRWHASYEHADPRQGFHPDWNSCIFNYGRHEVRSFLLSSALFWLDVYHIDGLRVDAVASMLYLDYSRKAGEWIPERVRRARESGSRVACCRQFNERSLSRVSRTRRPSPRNRPRGRWCRARLHGRARLRVEMGHGLDARHAADTCRTDPVHRKYHQNELTFRMVYAFHENFVLPLSHDEVVHGKGSLLGKMPGDDWQKFANLRLLFAYMFAQPGKKLLFMGANSARAGVDARRLARLASVAGEAMHAG